MPTAEPATGPKVGRNDRRRTGPGAAPSSRCRRNPCFVPGPSAVRLRCRAQSVAFINPGKSDEVYWMTATQGMQAVARSLGMTFEVQYAQREPLKTFEIAREMVARPPGKRPDYIVVTDDYSVADQLLKIIDAAGVKTFLAYSSIPVDQRGGVGSPRGKYKGWLGSLEPRAEDAGDLTADALIERGKRQKAFGPDGKLHLLAIAGDRSTPSSIKRNQGMRRAVAEDPNVVLDQEVYASWTREKAAEQAEWLYQRYPHARLIWAGNDLMAFGAMAAWEKRGGKPGADAWFSGINTSTEALEAVKSGRLTSLAGGHFITGAWTLVMIYDYHHGRDFADEGLELERPMFAEFTPLLADRYIQQFSGGFDSIDFGRYSKVKNPQLKRYNFGFAQLLEAKPWSCDRDAKGLARKRPRGIVDLPRWTDAVQFDGRNWRWTMRHFMASSPTSSPVSPAGEIWGRCSRACAMISSRPASMGSRPWDQPANSPISTGDNAAASSRSWSRPRADACRSLRSRRHDHRRRRVPSARDAGAGLRRHPRHSRSLFPDL